MTKDIKEDLGTAYIGLSNNEDDIDPTYGYVNPAIWYITGVWLLVCIAIAILAVLFVPHAAKADPACPNNAPTLTEEKANFIAAGWQWLDFQDASVPSIVVALEKASGSGTPANPAPVSAIAFTRNESVRPGFTVVGLFGKDGCEIVGGVFNTATVDAAFKSLDKTT